MNLTLRTIPDNEARTLVAGVSDIAYSEEFCALQKKRYGMHSEFAGVYENDALRAVIPVNYIPGEKAFSVHKDYTRPHVVSGGAIDWQEAARALKDAYGVRYAELNVAGGAAGKSPLSAFVLTLPDGKTHDDIMGGYDKKTRNEVRKANKFNFILQTGGAEMLDAFWGLYRVNMKRHGTPPRSRPFFDELFGYYDGKCRIIGAFDGDTLAGANLFLMHNAYLRLALNVSDVAYWEKCVNDLLYDAMIAAYYAQGIRFFDFGPSLNKDVSHNRFKLGFGAQQIPIVTYAAGSRWHAVRKWAANKRHALRIRLRRTLQKP
ncbi:MAG: GNAT family N-acetyltransferase [Patescibacteria group bacterium]